MTSAILATVAIVGICLIALRALRRLAIAERQNALLRADLFEVEQSLREARYFPSRRRYKEVVS